jgi:hypothetical protein
MKKMPVLFSFIIIACLFSSNATSQNVVIKKNPSGKWNFEAPYAPEGYKGGTIEITFSENKFHASMAFLGNSNIFPASNVRFQSDTLTFNVFVEDQDVAIKLALTEDSKMKGKAVYTEGVVPLELTREKKNE